ncbi:hypothetical protein FDI40_gp679 [Agrobacterium phage Atu_ph07]|uniref:Uncharacterized protein n=1 Tax=Agrobacterium phage Atu_ph07 TaxID=2024264 RepID=A0A2L0V0W9_9CAUD|nr:hypothetical protein FDI40_gp679 [Agrobacterium phage Atu_ph07]AUZ95429.1 hypothetical protein [Agrobacterium phage Atu_ph07]
MIDMAKLKKDMHLFRQGYGLPDDYIEIHRQAAERNIFVLEERGFSVISKLEMKRDGWFDGMKTINVEAINIDGQVKKFYWSDSNGGCWFEKHESGASLFALVADNVGYL